MKEWRKLIWSKSRAYVNLRLSDLHYLGIHYGENWSYRMTPKDEKLVIEFKKAKK